MSEMEEKLGTILSNPQLMQQIMSLAGSLGQQEAAPQPPAPTAPALPGADSGMLQAISGLASQSGIDRDQQNLLTALAPYVSSQRLHKLEKAMRASKMARTATAFLNAGGLQLLTGR